MKVLKQLEPKTRSPNAVVSRIAVGFEIMARHASLKLARSSSPARWFMRSGGVSRMKTQRTTAHTTPIAPNPQNAQRHPSWECPPRKPARTDETMMPK